MRRLNIRALLMLACAFISTAITSCGYEDYSGDYDYSAIYYGSQRPLRTLIVRDNESERRESLSFKSGVAIGGLMSNTKGYWAEFVIDEELFNTIEDADQFTLLPADCYTMDCENNQIYIPVGEFLGDFTISIKDELFDLPDFETTTYALPFRLTSVTADQMVEGKDYTIIALNFAHEATGSYYASGTQQQYTNGVVTQTITYPGDDINDDELIRTLSSESISPNILTMDFMGYVTSIESTDKVAVALDDEGGVELKRWSKQFGGSDTNAMNGGVEQVVSYTNATDDEARSFTLTYSYWRNDLRYDVTEVLTQRKDPEDELNYTEW